MPQATAPSPQSEVVVAPARQAPTATEMYEAAQLHRRELRNQQSDLQDERQSVRSQLYSATNPADKKGLEGRMAVIDQRIADVETQLAAADALVATRAAIPGVVIVPPSRAADPTDIIGMGMGFSLVLLFPLSVAYARRLWRRSSIVPPTLPPEFTDRMANLERGVEAIAIEVERLGEGQRFVTQLLSEVDRRRQTPALPSDQ